MYLRPPGSHFSSSVPIPHPHPSRHPTTLPPLPVFSLLGDKLSCGHIQLPWLSELEAGQSWGLKWRKESRGRLAIAIYRFWIGTFIDTPDHLVNKRLLLRIYSVYLLPVCGQVNAF